MSADAAQAAIDAIIAAGHDVADPDLIRGLSDDALAFIVGVYGQP
jgi:hypothetical protein